MSRIIRLSISLLCAVISASIALVILQADAQAVELTQASTENCGSCHSDFMQSWSGGAHGTALSDPIFNSAWTEQGQPGACLVCHTTGYDPATGTWEAEGVTCENCHNPIPENHPTDPMPVDKSTDLCGTCHSDTRFGWDNWKISAHYQRHMTCTVCHDTHSASLKSVIGSDQTSEDASGLCINCHQEHAMNFPYTSHHEQGLSCVNCHVTHEDLEEDVAHSIPDHSFRADLSSCTQCHESQMHGPGVAEILGDALSPISQADTTSTPVISQEPQAVSPAGYAGLAGFVGLAAGMVLSPWLEKTFRRMNKKSS